MVRAFSEVIRRPSDGDEHHEANAVGSHRPEIGLDCRVPETLYDLGGESAQSSKDILEEEEGETSLGQKVRCGAPADGIGQGNDREEDHLPVSP